MGELHEVLHRLPGYFKAITLELIEKPMSREQIKECMNLLEMRMGRHHRRDLAKGEKLVLTGGKYTLPANS